MDEKDMGVFYYTNVEMIRDLRIYCLFSYVLDKKCIKILLERPEVLPLTCHGHWMSLRPMTWI